MASACPADALRLGTQQPGARGCGNICSWALQGVSGKKQEDHGHSNCGKVLCRGAGALHMVGVAL